MKTIKIVLSILILLSVCNAQSDSLKQQAKLATVLTVATITSGVVTVIEAGKTGIIATKEVYNSKMIQNGINSSKSGASKLWNFGKAVIDSVKK